MYPNPNPKLLLQGLWMWSAPLRRAAPDGSAYYLVLLDSEGIDAYDQTTQVGIRKAGI